MKAVDELTEKENIETTTASDQPASHKNNSTIETVDSNKLMVVKGVERTFNVGGKSLQVLKGINMELERGKLVMLRGRSGSGKTTLLNCLGGLDIPSKGEVVFDNKQFSRMNDDDRTKIRRSQMGFIFQAYALMPLLSAWENVELSLRMAGTPRSEWKERVAECLELVGLGKRMKHRPFEMSGGEQQRVAIARRLLIDLYCCLPMSRLRSWIPIWQRK